jgi:hypothetical protein
VFWGTLVAPKAFSITVSQPNWMVTALLTIGPISKMGVVPIHHRGRDHFQR